MKRTMRIMLGLVGLALLAGCTSTTSTTHSTTSREIAAPPATTVTKDEETGAVHERTVRVKSSEIVVE